MIVVTQQESVQQVLVRDVSALIQDEFVGVYDPALTNLEHVGRSDGLLTAYAHHVRIKIPGRHGVLPRVQGPDGLDA